MEYIMIIVGELVNISLKNYKRFFGGKVGAKWVEYWWRILNFLIYMIKSDSVSIFTIIPIQFIISFTISDVGLTFILQQRRPIHEISIQKVKRYPFPNPGSFFGNIMSNKGERAE